MHRNWKLRSLAPLIGGGVLFALGLQIPESPLLIIGLSLVGLGILFMGFDSIITRESSGIYSEANLTETYTGFSAVAEGVGFVLVGLGVLGGAIIHGLGAGESVIAYLGQHPGLALLYGGAVALTFSIPGIIGSHEDRRSKLALLVSVPGRFLALIVAAAAILALLLGIWALVSPAGFDAMAQQFRISLHPFQR